MPPAALLLEVIPRMRIDSLGALVLGITVFGIAFLNLTNRADENAFWLLALLGVGLIGGAVARGLRSGTH